MTGRWAAPVIAAFALAPQLAHAQAAQDLFYERTVLSAANSRCGLFTPPVAMALAAGATQAHGAALRGGMDEDALRTIETNARVRARRIDCKDQNLAISASRARSAFSSFARLTRLSFPGELAGWNADRNITREPRWRLQQKVNMGGGMLFFGMAGRPITGSLTTAGKFNDGGQPYGARLVMRDDRRSPNAYLNRGGNTRGPLPLARRLPPAQALKSYSASARGTAGQDLLRDVRGGWVFRFPDAAATAMGALDPREAVVVEFLMPGDQIRRAYVEVGDFAAGRAFLQIPSP